MKTHRLGSAGPEISVVGFGAWEAGGSWGAGPGDDESVRAMQAGFDAGMTWIDTAEVYGKGKSEELVARAIAGRPDAAVFTKVAPKPAGTGFAPADVRAACEASLARIGRDAIDLYQLHWPDESVPLEETWAAMAALVDEGKVRFIGVSNFNQAQIETCEQIRHVDSLQPHFSMLHPRSRETLFPFCERNGTGIICYSPLAFGLLTGAITMESTFDDDDWRAGKLGMGSYAAFFAPEARAEKLKVVEALRPVAERLGITLAQLALSWVSHQVGVTGAIAGSRNATHTASNAGAGEVTLDDKTLEEIDQILV